MNTLYKRLTVRAIDMLIISQLVYLSGTLNSTSKIVCTPPALIRSKGGK
jgi:hypothetical protein